MFILRMETVAGRNYDKHTTSAGRGIITFESKYNFFFGGQEQDCVVANLNWYCIWEMPSSAMTQKIYFASLQPQLNSLRLLLASQGQHH